MASTALSRSILPQPPLVCHVPLTTLQMSSESFPFLTSTLCLLSSVNKLTNGLVNVNTFLLSITPLLQFALLLIELKINGLHELIKISAIGRQRKCPNFLKIVL
ncbi:hypothetical protein MIMGU_mgv1a026156mg [Erythranthe guttata]|uniref:Uncharacterized protein n=1 Tax=Erythranthe guttata TaxID=4155 RepID=A0A022R9N0_ERYGU|nr:hypothetical protein MIMGU_mgv1a026156mg [Erythranthe guttata]